MKKAALLAELSTEFDEIGLPVQAESYFNNATTKTYEIKVIRKSGVVATSPQKLMFYVIDEGGAGEEALYVGRNPVDSGKFEEALKVYIATDPFPFENWTIIRVVPEEEYAIIRAFSESAGDIKESNFYVYKKADSFTFNPYTGTAEVA